MSNTPNNSFTTETVIIKSSNYKGDASFYSAVLLNSEKVLQFKFNR